MKRVPLEDLETHTTLQTVRLFDAAFNRHDVDAIMALMTDDCVFENTDPPPDGIRLEGQADVRAFWVELFRESPHAHFAMEELFACRSRAVLRWRYSWGPGAADHVRGVDIFRVQDGKVAEKFSYVKG